jgi:hypothetical protein
MTYHLVLFHTATGRAFCLHEQEGERHPKRDAEGIEFIGRFATKEEAGDALMELLFPDGMVINPKPTYRTIM